MELLQRWTISGTKGNINYSVGGSESFDYKTALEEG